MPGELSTADKVKDVLVAIQQQRIKKFVDREIEVEYNVKKIYGLIKEKCSHSLRALLKQENDFEGRDSVQDVFCLM